MMHVLGSHHLMLSWLYLYINVNKQQKENVIANAHTNDANDANNA
jgi:hypothetical protein